jgi:hypothetical protein
MILTHLKKCRCFHLVLMKVLRLWQVETWLNLKKIAHDQLLSRISQKKAECESMERVTR